MNDVALQPDRRAGRHELAGRRRALAIAGRLGTAVRQARHAAKLTQSEVAARAGLTQTSISLLERGRGTGAGLETWSVVAVALGEQLAAFLEHASGADQPRDIEHIRRQSALITIASRGSWQGLPEFAVDPGSPRSRSIDVALIRPATREAIVAEIWDWFDDVGAGLRSLDGKVTALQLRLAHGPNPGAGSWVVRSLYVVRSTKRNHELLNKLGPVFAARFGGSSHAWLSALTDPEQRLPPGDGLLWSDRAAATLRPSRLRRRHPNPARPPDGGLRR